MEMRLRTPVTRGYFFLVDPASPRTSSIDKKKISSGTQGILEEERRKTIVPKQFETARFYTAQPQGHFLKRNHALLDKIQSQRR